jgi:hypothetical protein
MRSTLKRTDQYLATVIWLQQRRAVKIKQAMAEDARAETPAPRDRPGRER